MSHPPEQNLALDANRELAGEIGILLSAYAIIDLYVLHIFSVVSGMSKDKADRAFTSVRNKERITRIRRIIESSNRAEKQKEIAIVDDIDRANTIRNRYAHAIYTNVSDYPTDWVMSLWLSDGRSRRHEYYDLSMDIIRADSAFVRKLVVNVGHFGPLERPEEIARRWHDHQKKRWEASRRRTIDGRQGEPSERE